MFVVLLDCLDFFPPQTYVIAERAFAMYGENNSWRRPMKKIFLLVVTLLVALSMPSLALAHIPYVEREDYTAQKPFVVPAPIGRSIAVYAWLSAGDVDYYTFHLDQSEEVFLSSLIPRCAPYDNAFPWFTVAGSALPSSNLGDFVAYYDRFPVELFSVTKVWVVPNFDYTMTPRDEFFEFFAHKWYYGGPDFDQVLPAGDYRIYFWESSGQAVDYVAEIGKLEQWTLQDIFPAFFVTLPWLIVNGEIHDRCCHPRLKEQSHISMRIS